MLHWANEHQRTLQKPDPPAQTAFPRRMRNVVIVSAIKICAPFSIEDLHSPLVYNMTAHRLRFIKRREGFENWHHSFSMLVPHDYPLRDMRETPSRVSWQG